MTKEQVNNVERNMISEAINNIQEWSSKSFLAGGATSDVFCIKAIEDIKMTKYLNEVTALVSPNTLAKVYDEIVQASQSQSMFVDSDLLSEIVDKLNEVLKKNK